MISTTLATLSFLTSVRGDWSSMHTCGNVDSRGTIIYSSTSRVVRITFLNLAACSLFSDCWGRKGTWPYVPLSVSLYFIFQVLFARDLIVAFQIGVLLGVDLSFNISLKRFSILIASSSDWLRLNNLFPFLVYSFSDGTSSNGFIYGTFMLFIVPLSINYKAWTREFRLQFLLGSIAGPFARMELF